MRKSPTPTPYFLRAMCQRVDWRDVSEAAFEAFDAALADAGSELEVVLYESDSDYFAFRLEKREETVD